MVNRARSRPGLIFRGSGNTSNSGGAVAATNMTWADLSPTTFGDGTEITWAQGAINYTFYNADVVVYGMTPGGVASAISAKRAGASVLLVGGWREFQPGGMMTGGLSYQDFGKYTITTPGTICKAVFTRANAIAGTTDTNPLTVANISHAPRVWKQAFEEFIAAEGITLVYTTGITGNSTKVGTRTKSFITRDNKKFTAKRFIDWTYEGDLMKASGISYTVGREARDAVTDPDNGYLGPVLATDVYTYYDNTVISVDPYITPGVSGSGVLPGVNPGPYPAVGDADGNVQAGAFRMNLNHNLVGSPVSANFIPFPNTPPSGYNALNYEHFARACASLTAKGEVFVSTGGTPTTWRQATHVLIQGTDTSQYDVNNALLPFSDRTPPGPYDTVNKRMLGGIAEYVEADYTRREEIWQEHMSYILGFWYFLQYSGDSRIPSAMVDAWLSWGLDVREWNTVYGSDPLHFPTQLYIRIGRRMVGDFVWHTNDITATDGTTPRSTKTIAQSSYPLDSHFHQQIISGGLVRAEGGFNSPTYGGTDKIAPVPYEICLPKVTEETGMLVGFCASTTSEAFASYRIEPCLMLVGESLGVAAAMAALDVTDPNMQDINYSTLRTTLLANGMVLPQVN